MTLNINDYDLVCFSHLRWFFVYQRPQHLMSRFAKERRVFYIEEPFFDAQEAHIKVYQSDDGVVVVAPHLPQGLTVDEVSAVVRSQVDTFFEENNIKRYVLWYYTAMAIPFSEHLKPVAIAYDCMDELAAFADAPAALRENEAKLFACADVVFTGGRALYESKKCKHHNVHAFPSSVDVPHFAEARRIQDEPEDQKPIPHPRLGFFGVIDERMNLDLLREVAEARSDWHLVIVGPVVKIGPTSLPQRQNIHYLGGKSYQELPGYLAGWDAALLLFALNESTRFISPTKTPEYLAAGQPVVSTSIKDVVDPYGREGLVFIADTAPDFVHAIEEALADDREDRLRNVDSFLAGNCWDNTWARINGLLNTAIQAS